MKLREDQPLTRIDTYVDAVEILRSYEYENGMRGLHDGALLTLLGKPHTQRRRVESALFRVRFSTPTNTTWSSRRCVKKSGG